MTGLKKRDHPRLRGEQFRLVYLLAVQIGSPPLARGTGYSAVKDWWLAGITPACAGNRCGMDLEALAAADHPRLRGEQFGYPVCTESEQGSPPLARGTDDNGASVDTSFGITPACAGNRPIPGRPCKNGRDHPRLRGEQITTLRG